MMPEVLGLILFIVLGAVFGSFLTSFTWRYPRGLLFSKKRSYCPKCKKRINWYDNVPIVSFLVLGGACRNCKKKISIRYPAIEATTALGFICIWILFANCLSVSGNSATSAFLSPFCWWVGNLGLLALPYFLFIFVVLAAIFIIDLENQVIPDSLVFVLLIPIYLLLILNPTFEIYVRILLGLGSALFLLLVHLITKGKGMGLGDVKLALFAGTLLGWPFTYIWMFLAFLTGAVVGIILILIGKASFGKRIAFGPFLVFSLLIVLFFGPIFFKWLPIF